MKRSDSTPDDASEPEKVSERKRAREPQEEVARDERAHARAQAAEYAF